MIALLHCGGKVRYNQSNKYPSDPSGSPHITQNNASKTRSPLSSEEKEKWKDQITYIKKNYRPNTFKYNNLLAHCYKGLGQHEKAAQSYSKAVKLAPDKAKKSKLQQNVIKSYAEAGMAAELSGDYSRAVNYYKQCNKFCKYYGFGTHIPHSRIDHLKMKIRKKRK